MPPKGKAAAPKKSRAPKAQKLPDPLPVGEELKDSLKGVWRVGKPIGQGGFGLLYLASPASESVKNDPQYVVKVEPSTNGGLFSELSFYQRVAKSDMISQWASSRKMKSLGMPKYISSGKHTHGKTEYRFMIMERFDVDLQKNFMEIGKRFNRKTILTLACQILDTLEYIHSHEYVHADIKASNLLLGYGKTKINQAFLVDYGLAFRYIVNNQHKEYKEDPKRCHDGTIEFTSIDAHKGVSPSRRGDLEILGYCLLQWFCSKLPWEDKLTDPNYVRDQKIKYMGNVASLMKTCFACEQIPEEMQKYLEYVQKLKYDETPDYAFCKKLFTDALKKNDLKDDGKLDFSGKVVKTPTAKPTKRKKAGDVHNVSQTSFNLDSTDDIEDSPPKRGRKSVSPVAAAKKGTARKASKASPVKPSNRGIKRVQSPNCTNNETPSPARSRAKTTPRTSASPRKTKSAGAQNTPTANGVGAVRKKPGFPKASVGTQTSPYLKGLKRTRERKAPK